MDAVDIKGGFSLTFALALIYANVVAWVASPIIFNGSNTVAALFLTSFIAAVVRVALGVLGGFVGKGAFKNSHAALATFYFWR